MTDHGQNLSSTGDPPGSDSSSENASPTPQEIRETAQRMLVSLTEEQQIRLRNGVMRTMSEKQRQQASATKKDPLIQFIYQKARQDIMNRKAMNRSTASNSSNKSTV